MPREEKVEIRMTLDGKIASRFMWLKDRFGVKNNSELLRLLISMVYRTEKELGHLTAILEEVRKERHKE